ncbi:MAG: sigma 54-interacting transcriptional regulator, partial [Desulfovibrionaceae bacterium]|nr:sigma 54-interacting transcriptional regulator [Desulfovibrionaceae bacterium]
MSAQATTAAAEESGQILVCWIGKSDLKAGFEKDPANLGPIAMLLSQRSMTRACLLHTQGIPADRLEDLRDWLAPYLPEGSLVFCPTPVTDPIDYQTITTSTMELMERVTADPAHRDGNGVVFHTSPGTPAMQAVLLLLSRIHYRSVRLVQTRLPHQAPDGRTVLDVSLPAQIDISVAHGLQSSADSPEIAMEERMRRAAGGPPVLNLLLFGESGSGKTRHARQIHAWSERTGNFVHVNCATANEALFESQFFGHKKGSFTGADRDADGFFLQADRGTLFLDEIGDLPLGLQARLLTALDTDANGKMHVRRLGDKADREADVRVVSATNRDILAMVREGAFRADLYYRLAGFTFTLTPLRCYPSAALQQHILDRLAELGGQCGRKWQLSDEAMQLLLDYDWPGNFRELQLMVARCCVLARDGDLISADIVREQLSQGRMEQACGRGEGAPLFVLGQGCLEDRLEAYKREMIQEAMSRAGGNRSAAATLLGMPYQKL